MRVAAAILTMLLMACRVVAGELQTSAGTLHVEPVLTGLAEPWSLAFLPDGGFLVTERSGNVLYVMDGAVREVAGLPKVAARGQGGLLDVLVPADFARRREILFTYAQPGMPVVTALGSGVLSEDGSRLDQVRRLFQMTSPSGGDLQFGSRLVEAPDGHIFMTIGDRRDMDEAQNLGSHNGTVLRLNRDGSAPDDNPFVGVPGALAEIWSYGHRNPQGAALDLRGRLWINEHGAMGGDEVNRILPGANYGWPVIAYGRHYSGAKIGKGTAKPGMEQPAHYWDPSMAPSGMMVYSGKLWHEWRGDFFIGSLKFDYLSRLDPDRGWVEERIKGPETARVRDVREAPDGSIWFLSVDNGAVYRIAPG